MIMIESILDVISLTIEEYRGISTIGIRREGPSALDVDVVREVVAFVLST